MVWCVITTPGSSSESDRDSLFISLRGAASSSLLWPSPMGNLVVRMKAMDGPRRRLPGLLPAASLASFCRPMNTTMLKPTTPMADRRSDALKTSDAVGVWGASEGP